MTMKSLALRLLPGALLCVVLAILMAGGWLPTRKKPPVSEVTKVEVPPVAQPEPVPEPAGEPAPIVEEPTPPTSDPEPEPEPVSHALAAMDLIAKMRAAPPASKPKTVKRSPAPPAVVVPLPIVDPGPAPTGPRWPTYVVRLRDDALPWWRLGFREGGE